MRLRFPTAREVLIHTGAGGVFAGVLVAIALAVNPGYFGYDDALNDMLPAYHSMWRMITSGTVPILDASIISGGNNLVNIAHAPFHPFTLLVAATWTFGNATLVSAATGFLLIFGTFTGTSLAARAGVGLSSRDALIAAAVTATSPMLLGTYVTTWWAVGLGMVGYFWATGALLWASRDQRPGRLLLLGVTTCGLFLTGWPQSWLIFAITCLTVANHSRQLSGVQGWRGLVPGLRLAVPVVLGMLAASPAYSEYLALNRGGYLGRFFVMANGQNQLVPTFSQLLSFANPTSADFLHSYWGYAWLQIPVGFVSLLLLVAIFFVRHNAALWKTDRMLQLLAINTGLCYALTQLPSTHGPLHDPLRYLPYGQFFMILAALYYLAHTDRVWSRLRFDLAVSFVVAGAIYSAWRVPEPTADRWHSLVLPLLSVLVTTGLLWVHRDERWRARAEVGLVLAGTVLSILQLPAQTIYTVDRASLPDSTAMAQLRGLSAGGFLLDAQTATFEVDAHGNDWVSEGRSSRYALYDVPLMNGYEPIGLIAYRSLVPVTVHGYLYAGSIDQLGPAPAPYADSCWLDLFRVSAVLTDADPATSGQATLTRCGFTLHSTRGSTSLYLRQRSFSDSRSTVSAASSAVRLADDQLVSDLVEQVNVTNTGSGAGQVAFARLAWPGYTATLDGQAVPVSAVDGVVVSVTVPAGASGRLELRYWPTSWGVALPLSGLCLLLLVALPVLARVRRRPSGAATVPSQNTTAN